MVAYDRFSVSTEEKIVYQTHISILVYRELINVFKLIECFSPGLYSPFYALAPCLN